MYLIHLIHAHVCKTRIRGKSLGANVQYMLIITLSMQILRAP